MTCNCSEKKFLHFLKIKKVASFKRISQIRWDKLTLKINYMIAIWTVWCGHSAFQCYRHHKILQYHLTLNHTNQLHHTDTCCLWKCLNISQNTKQYLYIQHWPALCAVMSVYWAAEDINGSWTSLQTEWWFYFSSAIQLFYTNRVSQ